MNKTNTRKALNPAYRKHKPLRKDVNSFTDELLKCLVTIKSSEERDEHEEHYKEPITSFFKNTFYKDNYINTKNRIDLAIYTGKDANSDVGVLLEVKRPSNTSEFLTSDNLNRKALQELLLYYLRERIDLGNNNIKHLIATNGYEWFLFKSEDFYNYFYKSKALVKEYESFRDGNKDSSKNELFYNEIAKKYIAEVEHKLPFVHINFKIKNIKEYSDANLNTLYKIFSDVHILGNSFGNDSNQLNKTFYNELLHIIGLEEIKDKGKKIIQRKDKSNRDYASILENAISTIEDEDYLNNIKSVENRANKAFEAGLELTLTWINRILFLKLLESQLLTYHNGAKEYQFLNSDFINGYDELNHLFFSALAKKPNERSERNKERFKYIPYLNSSLFERNTLENETFAISGLKDDELKIFNQTVLKDGKGKTLKGKLSTLDYLFKFLDAYDFATDGTEGIEDEKEEKTLINASVLGLIFEKINGYKEGSFYTPAYITMYMSKETLRRAVTQKFKEQENEQIETFEDLKAYTHRFFKSEDLKRFNKIINSIKIVDPAVGSGHFLVSALNELISIKSDLKILIDENGNSLRSEIIIHNDELYITDEQGHLLVYKPNIKETALIQKTLFHEKQTLIENCLFGVDINLNSVKICRLRLWIELLKNTYYTDDNQLQTLPNIDINIKVGNSLISRFGLDDDLKSAFKGKDVKYKFKDYKTAVSDYKKTNDKKRKREVLEIIDEVKSNFKSTLDNKFIDTVQKLDGAYKNEKQRLENLKKLFNEKIKKIEKDNLKKLKDKAEKAIAQKEEIINNKIYHNAFEWRFEFPEVLDDKGNYIGFDVVIGNPPYFQINSLKYSEFLKKPFKTYSKSTDIYTLFYERGIQILVNDGYLNFITSSRFCTTNYGQNLRAFISELEVSQIVNFNDIQVFEDANVNTLIMEVKKANSKGGNIKFRSIKFLNNIVTDIYKTNFIETNSKFFKSNNWMFYENNILEIKHKLQQDNTELVNLSDLFVNRGVTTGANKIFIISESIKDKLIEEDEKSAEIIKPILKGADIKRYKIIKPTNWIIFTRRGVNIENYPAIQKYLSQFKNDLTPGIGRKKGNYKWYEVQDNTAFYKEFEKKKIVWTRLSNINSFSISTENEFTLDSSSFATYKNPEYLCAILNSKPIFFFFKLGAVIWGKDGIKWFGEYFDSIPIKQITEEDQQPFTDKANQILELKKADAKADTSKLEEEIDQMVYEIYNLSDEEIAIIENSTK